MIITRHARPEDFKRMYDIEKVCRSCRFKWTKKSFTDSFTSDNVTVIVAESSVASVILGFIAIESQAKSAYVLSVDVIPDWQHSGIGTKLLQAAEDEFRQLGFSKMTLHVWVKNPAQCLYMKRGYVAKKVVNNFYRLGEHGILMEKEL